jgi:acyl-CoA synthetase (NDP forming)
MEEPMTATTPVRLSSKQALERLTAPRSLAFVGASASIEKPSGQPVRNIFTAGFDGEVYAVNRRAEQIGQAVTVASVEELPSAVDVAFVTVPAADTPATIRALGQNGTQVAVVAVGGFAEMGTADGSDLTAELRRAAEESGVRMVGPVCNGTYSPANRVALGYNVIHTRRVRPGHVALVSHSGALVGPFVARLEAAGAGLSHYFSAGSEIDLTMADFVDFLADDDATSVIALIIDHAADGSRLRRAIRRARHNGKEIVALRLGESTLGAAATLAHSSHLSGSREVYRAVFAADGVRMVPTLDVMAATTAVLSAGRKAPAGTGIVACSTSGGGAINLADRLSDAETQPFVPALSDRTVAAINEHLRFDAAMVLNPFDLGLGGRYHYAANIENLASDEHAGVLIVLGTPMATSSKREQLAGAVADAALAHPNLPVLYLTSAPLYDDERRIFEAAGVPVFGSTLDAIAVASALLPVTAEEPVAPRAQPVAMESRPAGPLSEAVSKDVLRSLGVTLPEEHLAATADAAVSAADQLGYPVAIKATGSAILHKSDLGLVQLGLADAAAVRAAVHALQKNLAAAQIDADGFLISRMQPAGVEVICGVTRDPEFGQTMVLGLGGVFVDLLGASAMAHLMVPASRSAIERAVNSGTLGAQLRGYRGAPPADARALVDLVERIGHAAAALGDRLEALDINPILVGPVGAGAHALDALLITTESS